MLFLVKLLIFHGAFIAQSRVQVTVVVKVNPSRELLMCEWKSNMTGKNGRWS